MIKYHTFLISLDEAFEYLISKTTISSKFELQEISGLLTALVSLLLDKGTDYSLGLNNICYTLEHSGYSKLESRDICDTVFSLIINKIIEFIPGFCDDRFIYNFKYTILKYSLIKISIESSVYLNYAKQ